MQNRIVVTGANKGIGFEVTQYLLEHNYNVVAISKSDDNLRQLKSKRLKLFKFDLCADLDFKNLTSYLTDQHIQVQALLNNAGILINKLFLEQTIDDWRQTFETNLFAGTMLIKALHPFLSPKSHIVNISSMGGFQGASKFKGLSSYSASKGALAILTEVLALEFQNDAISVNALCLGAVQTDMLAQAFPGYQTELTANKIAPFITEFLLKGHEIMNGKIIPISMSNP